MKVSELIAHLEVAFREHGDVDVMMEDELGRMTEVISAPIKVAEADEYPIAWAMPEGFTFVLLRN